MLSFHDTCQGFSLPVLNDNIEFMITFEELIDFRDGEMIYHLQFMNLFLKHNSLMTSDLVFVDNVDSSCQGRFFMNDLSELIELILFKAWGEHVVLLFNAALDLLDEVSLLKLNVIFLTLSHHISCTLFSYIF